MSNTKEHVIKRDGTAEEFNPNKVLFRIKNMCSLDDPDAGKDRKQVSSLGALNNVNYDKIARQVISRIFDGITTSELDDIAASLVAPMGFEHPEYEDLATRILVSNHQKSAENELCKSFGIDTDTFNKRSFYYTCMALWDNVDQNHKPAPLIAPHIIAFVKTNADVLESILQKNNDFNFKYAGFIKLYDSYLLRCSLRNSNGEFITSTRTETVEEEEIDPDAKYSMFSGQTTKTIRQITELKRFVVETPQHMWLRVALGIHLEGLSTINNDTPSYKKMYDTSENKTIDFWNELVERKYSINPDILETVKTAYDAMSNGLMTHATPTLFHAGGLVPQLSSCFLTTVPDDSMGAIADYWKRLAMIAKWAGGLGSHVHHIRPAGSYIAGTGGTSNGLPKMLKVVNEIALYVDQGGNKRPGSHALYLEPWHGDIMEFLDLKSNRGNLEKRAKSLFYAVWLNDEFMRTVEREDLLAKKGQEARLWYLMDPTICVGLSDAYDKDLRIEWVSDEELFSEECSQLEFTRLYRGYVRDGKYMKRLSASNIWKKICALTQETGIPYKLHKDAANRKTNHNNLGTIKSSNLCCEIMEYSDANETAVCNLASICLGDFVVYEKPAGADKHPWADGFPINTDIVPNTDTVISMRGWIDFDRFESVVRTAVLNLNQVIDNNYYPIESAKRSNKRHRPIGLGVQGLADMFSRLWLVFGSDEAMAVDAYIFERMYYAALDQSCKEAERDGHYESFDGSWASQGVLQFDLWKNEHINSDRASDKLVSKWKLHETRSSQNDWTALKQRIQKHGLRNSLLVAPMPTASTSTIMGNSPAFEPHNALIYKRSDKHGESSVCNRDLQESLIARGLWTSKVQNALMNSRTGSIQDILEIPRPIRDVFKTAFDLSPKAVINHALARSPFVDQSMSMNLFVPTPTHKIITQIHFYSWKRGIKTGGYYLRRLPPADAKKIQLTDVVSNLAPASYGDVCAPDCDSCGA